MSTETVDGIKVVLSGEDAPYLRMIQQVELATAKMVTNIENAVSTIASGAASAEAKVGSMADKMIAAGSRAAMALTTSMSAVSAISIKAYSDFDDAMVKSTAIMSDMTDGLRGEMGALAIQMSTESTTSAAKLAEAYLFLGSSGLSAQQSMDALSVVNTFSIAGNFDLARATDMLADSQSALGLRSADNVQNMENMARVADVLTKANILSNASVEQFATSLTTKTAAALRGLNKDVEEGVAVLAAYADQGIKAQLSGEKLAVLLRESQTASAKNADEWKRLGVELYDTNGKMIPIVELIRKLETATKGMSDQQKFATFHMMGFRAESMDAIKPLLGMSDKIAAYEKELRSAGGATQDIADNNMASFSAEMTILKNQITAVAIEIGKILAPSVLAMNNLIRQGLAVWHGMSEEMKIVAVTAGKIAAIIGPAMISLGLLGRFAPMLMTQMTTMTANLATALTWVRNVGLVAALPFIKVIAVIGLVSAAVYGLAYLIVGPEGLKSAWNTAAEAMEWFFNGAVGFLANFTTNVGLAIEWIKTNWLTLITEMFTGWVTMQMNMLSNVMVAVQTMVRLYIAFAGWLYEYVPRFFKYIFSEGFLTQVFEGIQAALKAYIAFGVAVLQTLGKVFYGLQTIFFSVIKAMLGISVEFANTLGSVFSRILRGEIPNPAELIQDFMVKAGAKLKDVSVAVGEAVGHAGEVAAAKLKAAQDQAVKDFNRGGKDINFFKTAGEIIGEGFDQMNNPLDGFKSNLTELPKFVFDMADKIDNSMAGLTGKSPEEQYQDMGAGIEAGLVDPLAGAEKQANLTAAAVSKVGEGIEGAAKGSLEAALKIDSFLAKMGQTAGVAVKATGVVNQASKITVATTPVKATGTEVDSATSQRGLMIGLLTQIRDNIAKPGAALKPANLG